MQWQIFQIQQLCIHTQCSVILAVSLVVQTFRSLMNDGNHICGQLLFSRLRFNSRNSRKYIVINPAIIILYLIHLFSFTNCLFKGVATFSRGVQTCLLTLWGGGINRVRHLVLLIGHHHLNVYSMYTFCSLLVRNKITLFSFSVVAIPGCYPPIFSVSKLHLCFH